MKRNKRIKEIISTSGHKFRKVRKAITAFTKRSFKKKMTVPARKTSFCFEEEAAKLAHQFGWVTLHESTPGNSSIEPDDQQESITGLVAEKEILDQGHDDVIAKYQKKINREDDEDWVSLYN